MNILFVKRTFEWPLRTGAAVHSGNLMKQLVKLGHQVQLLTVSPVNRQALQWLDPVVVNCVALSDICNFQGRGYLAHRFQRFWNIPADWIEATVAESCSFNADAVVAVGQDTLPILAGVESATRIWYVADDPILQTVSCAGETGWDIGRLRLTAINLAYERYYRRSVDAAWVVSNRDQLWLKRTSRFSNVDVVRNGVDTNYFRPQNVEPIPETCAFWGRLDFPPNDQALRWFLVRVWPQLRAEWKRSRFRVFGISPSESLRNLFQQTSGVEFAENLPDLRSPVCQSAVAVFPMVSGAGVKNKVLEAAAMGRAICATKRCLEGLDPLAQNVFAISDRPSDWVEMIGSFWRQPENATCRGNEALNWVRTHHSWESTAHQAMRSIEQAADT